jgi:hypothetical protein
MNKVLIIGSGVFTLAAAGLMLAPSFASAQTGIANGNGGRYGYTQSLTTKAEAMGMTSEELTAALETKTLLQIAEEKNVSLDSLHETMETAAKARWAANGLSQEEIDARLADMEERQANCVGSGMGSGNGGGRHGRMGR